MNYKLNYPVIPTLAIGFSRSNGFFGRGIQLFRGIIGDKAAPTHAFIVTEDHGQLFATEETIQGLQERSLEGYNKDGNRIVAMYYSKVFDSPVVREEALKYLAEIRRRNGEESHYDWKGLLSFVPGFKKFCKPDPKKQWCSENCASLLLLFGAEGIDKTELSPDQLLKIMKETGGYKAVLNYYS